jgi:hypothetical protein
MKRTFFILTGLIIFLNFVYADNENFTDKTINWTSENILYSENITVNNSEEISISHSSYLPDAETDFIYHFENAETAYGNYSIFNKADLTAENPGLGKSSGHFTNSGHELKLIPEKGSIFEPGSFPKSFTIEFSICPEGMGKQETLLHWSSALVKNGKIINQFITCSISNRKVNWNFYNFFIKNRESHNLQLHAHTALIPDQWSRHIIRFDNTTGMIEYIQNSIPQDIKFVTETGHENGKVDLPQTGEADSFLSLGKDFTGKIDEIRIMKKFETSFINQNFRNKGIIVTQPIDFGSSNTLLKQLAVQLKEQNNSNAFFYFRITEDRVENLKWADYNKIKSDLNTEPCWTPITPNQILKKEIRGRYIQILVELHAGTNSDTSPYLSSLQLETTPDQKPLPPANLIAIPGNKSVTLKWNNVGNPDLKGYIIYYGTNPGEYFGENASIGDSPAVISDTNNITINNLENGILYFFSVVAYDKARVPHLSVFSNEVSVRPARIYGGAEQ